MSQTGSSTFYCEHRERLIIYMSQAKKALLEAQERPITERPFSFSTRASSPHQAFGMDLVTAAAAWKRARLSYEKHVREHGCSPCSGNPVAGSTPHQHESVKQPTETATPQNWPILQWLRSPLFE